MGDIPHCLSVGQRASELTANQCPKVPCMSVQDIRGILSTLRDVQMSASARFHGIKMVRLEGVYLGRYHIHVDRYSDVLDAQYTGCLWHTHGLTETTENIKKVSNLL